jgi:hypothetical protein
MDHTENTGEDHLGFSKPVPTKFKKNDENILEAARKATGFTNSELIRRAVRLLGRQHAIAKRYDFLLELTA